MNDNNKSDKGYYSQDAKQAHNLIYKLYRTARDTHLFDTVKEDLNLLRKEIAFIEQCIVNRRKVEAKKRQTDLFNTNINLNLKENEQKQQGSGL